MVLLNQFHSHANEVMNLTTIATTGKKANCTVIISDSEGLCFVSNPVKFKLLDFDHVI